MTRRSNDCDDSVSDRGRPAVEYAGGASLAAYRSLSRHTGVPLERVLAHAGNNTLAAIIEMRGGRRGIDPDAAISYLYMRRVLSALSDRWALIAGGS